ncbi:S8 family serine peptidase [Streptomyces sp. NPDC056707]|uniref:S8 family serine peptidase n=1 Tax=Streptomyces sp. NPDC056707 TaxID=3345919 RepID=UPI003698DB17
MSQPPPRRRGLIALGAALAVLTAIVPAAADAAPARPSGATAAPGARAAARPGPARTVTLITGDKVTVTTTADGHNTASVLSPNGGPVGAHVMSVGKDTWVYPDAAMPYLASGALDARLFNVTELLAYGYDDAHSDHLPLIVTYTDAAAHSRSETVPPGARRTLTLSSIQGAALVENHADADDFWASLTRRPAGERPQARTAAARALTGGIAKIWLDGKAKVALSDSTAQIGAPEVWQSGGTGQGVHVAVLDTGIDATHPDFDGQIAATASFVPDEDVTDRHGHGTHVASTVAGTGAAAGGKEKGVAPGAALHIGKVLDNTGSGQDSWILAGMEWAARDQHAKVVSMSLGAGPTDGTDPLSQAVNKLSDETGALFVIAAGNSGPDSYTINAPGAADAALTVGAVDSTDHLAVFSSRGPRVGDSAIKPELTAPGVDILAARSQYAPEGDGSYQSMSGTSMATPHVAGAAALLSQAHPDWSGQQLKDALVSTTKTTRQYSPYTGGSGRLDIAAAITDEVFATGSAFMAVRWPYPANRTVRKDVTYTNTGSQPITLDLTLTAPGLPDGLFTLTAPRVTVPAHGASTVGVLSHLDSAEEDAGYSAVLNATGPDGRLRTHTIVGSSKEGQRVKLSVKAKDKSGAGLSGILVLKDVARDVYPKVYTVDETGSLDLSLAPSTYSASLYADLPGIDGPHSLGRAVISSPEVIVGPTDRALALDASAVRKVEAITPQRTTNSYVRVDQRRTYGDLHPFFDSYQLEPWTYDSLWATPTAKVTQGSYNFTSRWRQVQQPLTVSSGSQRYDSVHIQSLSPMLPKGTANYEAVYAGNGSTAAFAKLKVRGRIAVVRRSDVVTAPGQAAAAAKAGAKMLLTVNDGYGPLDPWSELPEGAPLPVVSLGTDDGQRLLNRFRHGKAKLRLASVPHPEYLYDLVQHHDGSVPKDLTYRPGSRDLARINQAYRDTKQGKAIDARFDLSDDLTWAVSAAGTQVRAQGTYTTWVTAGPGVGWLDQAAVSDLTEVGAPVSYRPGSTTKATWFGPVLRPRLLSAGPMGTPPSRVGNILGVYGMPAWGDTDGHMGTIFDGDFRVKTSLYQGDTLLSEGDGLITAEVAPEPLPYRLVVDSSRNFPNRPYSSRTRTDWSFISDEADAAVLETLPLVQLDYKVSTDLSGKARRQAGLTVTASHLEGVPANGTIRTVGLEVSYDDGATWHRANLRHQDGGWQTHLDAPAKARYATLRASAHDSQGNSVSQTVYRAFGLK